MNTLRFIFGLVDNMSGPAGRIIDRLRALTNQVERARLSFDRMYQSTQAIRAATMTMFAGLAAAGVGGLVAIGKLAIGAASFKENTMAALTMITRSKTEAASIFSEAIRYAAITPFDTQQVVSSYTRLLQAGFKRKQVPIVLSAIGDLSSMKGFSQEAIDQVTLAVTQIKIKGKLQGNELLQLSNFLPQKVFFEVLAQKIGVTVAQVHKLQEAGKISGDTAIWGILETTRRTLSGGKLGGLMDATSKNISGLWSTLASRPFEIFTELDKGMGFKSLKTVIDNVGKALDTATPTGKKFSDAMNRAMGTILGSFFGPLEKATSSDNIGAFLDKIADGVNRFAAAWAKYMPQVIAFIQGLGSGIMVVAGPLIDFISGLSKANGGGAAGAKALGEMAGKVLALAVGFSFLLVPIKIVFSLFTGVRTLFAVFRSIGPVITTLRALFSEFGIIGRVIRLVWGIGMALGRFFISMLVPTLQALGSAVMFVGRAFLAVLGPVGLVIAIVMAVGAAAVYAYNHWGWFHDTIDRVWAGLKVFGAWLWGWVQQLWTMGSAMVDGLLNGLVAGWGKVKAWFTNLGGSIKGWFAETLGIHSPSTVFADFGGNITDGLANGLAKGMPDVKKAVIGLGDMMSNTFTGPRLPMPTYTPVPGQAGGAPSGTTQALFNAGGSMSGLGLKASGTTDLAGTAIGQAAMNGLSAGWAEAMPGYCSRFVRQVFAKTLGPKTAALFGSTAIQSEARFKAAGLTRSVAQINRMGGLRSGDVLFQGYGSGGAGHTGIYVGNGMVAQNTTARGQGVSGNKKLLPLSAFGGITSVGRYSLGLDGGRSTASLPAVMPARAGLAAPRPMPMPKAKAPAAVGTGKPSVTINMGGVTAPAGMKPADRAALLNDVEQRAHEGTMRALEGLGQERGLR